MTRKRSPRPGERTPLRARAETALSSAREQPPPRGTDRLAYELRVHEVELRMQNEELRGSQLALEESRDRYRELYDFAPIAYLALDRTGRICEANLKAASLVEVERGRLVGRRLTAFMSARDADRLRQHLKDVLENDRAQGFELELRCESGRRVAAHVDATAIADAPANAEEPAVRCVLLDLSVLRHAQEWIRAQEARSRTVLDAVTDAIVTFDTSGRIDGINRAAEDLFGYTGAHLRGTTIDALVPEYTPASQRFFGAPVEVTATKRGGATFPAMLGVAEWTEHGERKLAAVFRDLTRGRAAERELRHAQKMESIGALASGVAHDFGNLLQVVISLAGVAALETTPVEQARDAMRQVIAVALRAGELSQQLLSLGRKRSPAPRPVAIDAAVHAAAPLIARILHGPVRLDLRARAPGLRVHADPGQLEQVLLNLAINARDAMPNGGTITIETASVTLGDAEIARRGLHPADRYVRLVVRDTGAGMDDETVARAFEPFFTTKDDGKGTGLGLATVRSIARELGGDADLESLPGRGTSVVLHLPECLTVAAAAPRGGAGDRRERLRGTILLVEDDPLVRASVRDDLKALGLHVLDAASGAEALHLIAGSEGVDALVSDVKMPGMSGPELAAQCRRTKPELPVLFLSANADAASLALPRRARRGRSAARELFLAKPFGRPALAEKLAALLSSVAHGRD